MAPFHLMALALVMCSPAFADEPSMPTAFPPVFDFSRIATVKTETATSLRIIQPRFQYARYNGTVSIYAYKDAPTESGSSGRQLTQSKATTEPIIYKGGTLIGVADRPFAVDQLHAVDLDGNAISTESLLQRFAKSGPAYVLEYSGAYRPSHSAPIVKMAPFYKQVLRDDLVILCIPAGREVFNAIEAKKTR